MKKLLITGLMALLLFAGFGAGYAVKAASTKQPEVLAANNAPPRERFDATLLWTLVNNQRKTAGLNELNLNIDLNHVAASRCNDMVQRNYWSHTSPDGLSPWHVFIESGYNYRHVGENLAENYDTNQGVVDGWMNSQEHRSNILDGQFVDTGLAVCQRSDGNTVIVQEFGSPF